MQKNSEVPVQTTDQRYLLFAVRIIGYKKTVRTNSINSKLMTGLSIFAINIRIRRTITIL